MTRTKLLWKCIPDDFTSHGHKWVVGKWFHVNGKIELCKNGFHASPTILDAMRYVNPGWVCRVKVKGSSQDDGDKSAWSDMMVVKRCAWTKEMSVELAIYAAELVLPIFEKQYPDDKRPAEAIAAAKKWLADPSEENRIAAYVAHAAYAAAYDAARSAHAAAYVAYAAAHAADAAARDAAYAAAHAADAAAYAAAYDAARSAHAAACAAAYDAARSTYAACAAYDASAATLKKIDCKIKQLLGIRRTR
jgi:hypothetical protein